MTANLSATMDPTSSLSEDFAHLSVGDLNPPREATFRDATPPVTRVSRERDHFIDDDHKPLDAKLMKTFSAFRELNREPDLPALLCNITLGDNRLITLKEEEAEELLTRQPSISAILQKAWKEASFKEVRQLGAFFVLCFLFLGL
jgi:hypothetical protein